MKNKYMTLVALAAAALATSCASDDLAEQKQNQSESQTVTLTASVADDNTTRVGMTKGDDNKASFYWHSSDKILVQTVNNEAYSGAEFTTSATTGATDATFTGDVTGKVGTYAVYPYDSENQQHSFTSEKGLTFVLPANYTYNTVGNNIFSKGDTYPSNSTNMPMLGTIANGKISFKPLGGLAVIRIDEMPAASGTLTVTADQQLAGEFTVSDLSASDAKITNTATASDGDKTVSFTFGGPASGVGVFYLPLATGDYTNVKVKINDTEVDCGSVTISRAGVTAIAIATYGGSVAGYSGKLVRSYGNNKYYLGDYKYSINDHVFVDLGLTSGLLWATMNVGADSETAYGSYFAWGETEARTSNFNEDGHLYKETPEKLDATHDAATANWGAGVRMPTKAEFEELIEGGSCKWEFTAVDGVNGMKITNQNSTRNSIFLPAAGYYYKDYGLDYDSVECYYWASTSPTSGFANSLCYDGDIDIDESYSYFGYSVRPVAEKP